MVVVPEEDKEFVIRAILEFARTGDGETGVDAVDEMTG